MLRSRENFGVRFGAANGLILSKARAKLRDINFHED